MALNPDFPEREQVGELSVTRRYYSDILRTDDVSRVVMAVERMYEDLQIILGNENMELMRRQIERTINEPQPGDSPHDQLLLLPLGLVAPYIELTRSPAQIEAWYKEVVGYIVAGAQPSHDLTCLEESDEYPVDACTNSTRCPIAVTARELVMPVFNADFKDLPYLIDPEMAYAAVRAKYNTAYAFKLGDSDLMAQNFRQYVVDAREHFGVPMANKTDEE